MQGLLSHVHIVTVYVYFGFYGHTAGVDKMRLVRLSASATSNVCNSYRLNTYH